MVPLYEAQLVYAEQAENTTPDHLKQHYQKIVISPHWHQIAEGGEFVYLAQQASTPILDVETLASQARRLAEVDLRAMISESVEHVWHYLQLPEITVVVMVVDPSNTFVRQHMNGIVGYAPGSGKIWIQIDPSVLSWREWFGATLVHEYHHSAWIARHYRPFDLATYLIFEGRAEALVQKVYPDKIAPWTMSLEDEDAYWKQIERHLCADDWSIMSRFMFGNQNGIPQWAGYRFGFKMVQEFIAQHPELTVAEWTAWDAHDLIKTVVENK